MKKLIISAIALGLFMTAPAMAASNDHQDRGGRGQGQSHATMQDRHSQGGAQQERRVQPAVQMSRHSQGAAYQARSSGRIVQTRAVVRDRSVIQTSNRRANYTTQRANYTTQRANYATRRANVATQRAVYSTRRANYATQNANRATGRMNFATYRANVSSSQRYHWNTYQRPTGWYAHRWSYGEMMPSAYYSSNYWITDYISFGLMAPPSGLVWVRDDNDALLIDRYTGQIVRVEYNVFY